MTRGPLSSEELASDIYGIDLIKLLWGDIIERDDVGYSRVVYQDIQSSEERRRVVDEPKAFVDIRQIRSEEACPTSIGFDLLNCALRAVPTAGVVQHHLRALPCELQGNLAPDSGA
jgi:hypothetical protein